MGSFRFRKSVSIMPGVKLNIGKKGVSISSGIPGFRRTVHSSGRVTTSVGIPGTGIYYVDTKNPPKEKPERKSEGFFSELFGLNPNNSAPVSHDVPERNNSFYRTSPMQEPVRVETQPDRVVCSSKQDAKVSVPQTTENPIQYPVYTAPITSVLLAEENDKPTPSAKDCEGRDFEEISYTTIQRIFENCDVAVNWVDVLSNLTPTSDDFNVETWSYLHKKAVMILDGDIDTYLEVIEKVNPYDDLLDFAENFEFGTDDASMMEVEFSIIDDNAVNLSKSAFEDYYSSIAIRVVRDTFALLPVDKVVVHTMYKGKEKLVATFERESLQGLSLAGLDASDFVNRIASK